MKGAVFAAVPLLAGCVGPAALSYSGDGRMRDHGPFSHAQRYEVDLGPIDTTAAGTRQFRLSGLPRATFTVNLEIEDSERHRTDLPQAQYRGRVAVQMRNAAGDLVIDERAPISAWVRGFGLDGKRNSTFYRQGELVESPLPGGGTVPKPAGVKASGGWGTYFDADPREEYRIRIEVLEPLEPARPARISVTGWD